MMMVWAVEPILTCYCPYKAKIYHPFHGRASSHLSFIFDCLILYVYCLTAPAAERQASLNSHLTSFVYCLLPITQSPRVHCLTSAPQPRPSSSHGNGNCYGKIQRMPVFNLRPHHSYSHKL